MGLSGFLYVAIVVGWAVYLVPFALKRYDEAARNRSIERFSSAMRVLGQHEVDEPEAVEVIRATSTPSPHARPAARTAPRRRRRVLLVLLLATAATSGLAAAQLAPGWSVAVPGVLVLLWLLVCRRQARRGAGVRPARPAHVVRAVERAAADSAHLRDHAVVETPPAAQEEAVGRPLVSDGIDVDVATAPADDEPTVVLSGDPDDETEQAGTGSLWDPVPVTLPTYVHKPRAPRTIRTIDLGSAGVQSSGRKSAESAIYTHHVDPSSVRDQQEAAEQPQEQGEEHKHTRRAVGE